MILGDSTAQVELLVASLGDGDFVVTVFVQVGRFAGAVDTIVTGREWATFLLAIREVEQRRKGAAELDNVAAEDLRLWIGATDRAGHMAVAGQLRDPGTMEGGELMLRFGPVPFDPTVLPALVEELSVAAPAI